LADPLLEALARYAWPGNVRELEHALARAVERACRRSCRECPLLRECPEGCERCVSEASELPEALCRVVPGPSRRRMALDEERCRELMTKTKGNLRAAAKEAQVSRSTLWRRLRGFGIDPAEFRSRGA
jgi:transcriptional regulator of acetoin/glycerol metabolism